MKKILSMVAAATALSIFGGNFRVEAEQLKQIGEWSSESGKELSGGRALLSVQNGLKLSDEIIVPCAGKYYVWVRTKSFGEGWRNVEVSVNGKKVGIFGDEPLNGKARGSLLWKRSSAPVELDGTAKIDIKAPRGSTRLDVLVFADDEAFVPADDAAAIGAIEVAKFADGRVAAKPQTLRIEAEDLTPTGTWNTLEGVVMAGGKAMQPTAAGDELNGTFILERGGEFSVWVRVLTFGEGYRQCRLFLNDTQIGVFGDERNQLKTDQKSAWVWVPAGRVVKLPAGELKVKIVAKHSLARFDGIIISDDPDFSPNSMREVNALPVPEKK